MEWTYGEEGQAFPVEPGQLWRCGNHLFYCSDLMASDGFDKIAAVSAPGVLYCDPPWGQSLLNGFRTKAGLGRAEHRWEDLYRRIADMGHSRDIPVWIEGSKPTSRDGLKIPATIKNLRRSTVYSASWEVTYYGKHVSGLYYASESPVPIHLNFSLTGMDDDHTPGEVMRHYGSTGVVMDPCAGRGQTSRQAELNGWHSVNNELNPPRVSAALTRMSVLISEQPERLS